MDPLHIAKLFKFERYSRAVVNNDCYITSDEYKKQTSKDNSWVAFQHYLSACATATTLFYNRMASRKHGCNHLALHAGTQDKEGKKNT